MECLDCSETFKNSKELKTHVKQFHFVTDSQCPLPHLQYCRQSTIKIYLKILKKNPNIPDALMQVIAWVLGEYGSGAPEAKVRTIINLLAQFAYGTFEAERARASILLALTKLH